MTTTFTRWAVRALVLGAALVGSALAMSSCFSSDTQECASGLVCPQGTVCTADGTSCAAAESLCGNGVVDNGEACDDGNVLRGDGCSVDCTSNETCGNGFVDTDLPNTRMNNPALCLDSTATGTKCAEECDLGPGMNVPGSGCSPNCLSDESCGNGILDDHLPNVAPNPPTTPSPCLTATGADTNCAEVCDDGGAPGGNCSANCLSLEVCGNGITDVGEMCDDGDRDDASGCRNDCQSSAECGDGEVGPGEECDDVAESVSCDGPSAAAGEQCTIRVCGDGYVNAVAGMAADGSPIPGEICDPNDIGVDIAMCDRDCTRPACGDGITNAAAGEQCDDGQLVPANGDGCSTTCQLEPFSLGVTRLGGGTGTVRALPGIDCGVDCFEPYQRNSMVILAQTPAARSTFNGWTGCDSVNGMNQCVVTMTAARAVTATFELNTLTVVRDGTGAGTVTGTGVNCGADCAETYDVGTMVTLTAAPDAATSLFTGWSEPSCPNNLTTCTVTMNAARTVTATFTLRLFGLTVAKAGTGTGTVTSAPAGIACGADCTENYVSGTSVTLFAEPSADSNFTSWSFPACASGTTCTVPMTVAQNVTATFTLKTFTLTATRSGSGAGAVASVPMGITCGADCTENYNIDTMVVLTATPTAGSRFVGWTGACTGTGPCTVTMNVAKTVDAEFRTIFDLTVTKSGSGAGIVASTPAGIDCGADCSELYDTGTSVTLTPTPAVGSRFVGWSGACMGSGACTVSMTAARAVNAEFRTVFDLTVAKDGSGAGSVTSAPAGITCGADCVETYDVNTAVTLTATAAAGSRFAGWSLASCPGTGTCMVTMDAAKNVTATFTAIHVVTVTKIGSGAGTVTSAPAGITCGADCSEAFDLDTMVTLTATPTAGSRFVQWTGDCSGSGACSVTADGAKTVTAEFRTEFTLTVTKSGSGTGTVDSAPVGITCGADCSQLYDTGTSVTLTATAGANSRFVAWTGACTGSGPCIVAMTAARSVNAEFRTVRDLTVVKAGTGSGTVNSAPAGINCGLDCTEAYDVNDMVVLTAVAANGSRFVGWTGGGCPATGTCTVTMDVSKSVTATFTPSFTLTVDKIGGGSGTVTSVPAGINCGADCSEPYDLNATVALTATPAAGSRFVQWTGACTGSGACSVLIDGAKAVTAEFRPVFTLSVTKSGTGTGTVASAPAGITCGADCSEIYDTGVDVTLTPTADAGSRFVQWTGACTGTGACVVAMSQARMVNAEFVTVQTLTLTKGGAGSGTVTAAPAGVPGITAATCGPATMVCTSTFDTGASVVLTATPAAGSIVGTWTGCDSTTATTCTVAVNAAEAITVQFLPVFTLTVARDGSGSGTVTSAPAGITCGADCTEVYLGGTMVTLTAAPSSEDAFTGWSEASCPDNLLTCTVTMNAAKTVTATFDDNLLTMDLTGAGQGVVTSSLHAGTTQIICNELQTGNCEEAYVQGTVVTLTAAAPVGSRFVSWSGGGCPVTVPPAVPPASCMVTMSGPTTVQAQFEPLDPLLVTKAGGGTGTVTSSPARINCGAVCMADFDRLSVVRLTAVPTGASTFASWSANCMPVAGQPTACDVTINGATGVTATFNP